MKMTEEKKDAAIIDVNTTGDTAVDISATEPAIDVTDSTQVASRPSIYHKVKLARAQSTGNVDLGCKLFAVMCGGTICGAVMVFLYLAIPVTCIVLGSMNLDNCPKEKYIPIYLVVCGSVGIFQALMKAVCMCWCDRNNDDEKKKTNPLDWLLDVFMFAWLIAGSVWVYRAYSTVTYEDPTLPDYCDKTTYIFAFTLITIVYCAMGLIILGSCIGAACVACISALK